MCYIGRENGISSFNLFQRFIISSVGRVSEVLLQYLLDLVFFLYTILEKSSEYYSRSFGKQICAGSCLDSEEMFGGEVLLAGHVDECEADQQTDHRILLVHVVDSQILPEGMFVGASHQGIVARNAVQSVVACVLQIVYLPCPISNDRP